jgi:glycosyltransferase involved in cell wall biosynthesis
MTNLLIVTPAYNEEAALPHFIAGALSLRAEIAPEVDVRLLVVDDGSRDGTANLLRRAAEEHSEWIGYLSLASNAGHQTALIAGLCHAGSWPDAIVTMDADLEHPIPVVKELLRTWLQTRAIVVHAIRRQTRELPRLKRWPSSMFYKVTSGLTGLDLASGQADFRLWDAAVLRSVAAYLPHLGSLRVFAAWLPGQKASIEYEQHVQPGRTSRFTLRKNFDLAATSIIRFSHFPLQAITGLGLLGLTFALVYGVFIAIEAGRGRTVPGWSSTVLTVMAMGCLQLIALGVLASYFRRLVFARDLPPWVVHSSRLSSLESASRTSRDAREC